MLCHHRMRHIPSTYVASAGALGGNWTNASRGVALCYETGAGTEKCTFLRWLTCSLSLNTAHQSSPVVLVRAFYQI